MVDTEIVQNNPLMSEGVDKITPPLIEAKNIRKSFGGVQALKGVDFDLHLGEVHALVGENGAGKSTLIKVLTGVIQEYSGELRVQGVAVKISRPVEAHRMGIVAVYQEPLIYKHLSVLENIFLGNEIRKKNGNIDWKRQREKTVELLNRLNMEEVLVDEPMGRLSTGFQQLALIAKALAQDMRVIIFDEPTAILTPHETDRLFEIIQILKTFGTGILYISHRLDELPRVADRITVMRDGQITGIGKPSQMPREKIVALMVGHHIEEQPRQKKNFGTVVLKVNHLDKNTIFKDICFQLNRGEILGFSGLVGSGRSEVMKAIFGILPFDRGEIVIHGKNVNIQDPQTAIRLGIAYLPEDRQNQGLLQDQTVSDNICLVVLKNFLRPLGLLDHSGLSALSHRYIKQLGIKTSSIKTLVRHLSGGNQQKALLAKWLAVEPEILILDEPTRGVDVAVKAEIHQTIADLADQGRSIIIVSSELSEILHLSDRVIVMHEGSIRAELTGGEITPNNLLQMATGFH